MQANQSTTPKRLKDVVGEMYQKYGWKQGIMRGYWVRLDTLVGGEPAAKTEPQPSSSRLPSFAKFPLTQVSRTKPHTRREA